MSQQIKRVIQAPDRSDTTSELNRLFANTDSRAMLEGKYYCTLDKVCPFKVHFPIGQGKFLNKHQCLSCVQWVRNSVMGAYQVLVHSIHFYLVSVPVRWKRVENSRCTNERGNTPCNEVRTASESHIGRAFGDWTVFAKVSYLGSSGP